MLSKKMVGALNAQINAEMWSAYLYLSMSADAEANGFKGIANWFYVQFREEQDHARILMNYLLSRGERVALAPIAEVTASWATPCAAFRDTLEHEKEVTAMIDDLCRLADEEKDYATKSMLLWFVDEQVEEEENASDMLGALEQIGDNKLGIYMLDKELAERKYEPASALK